MIRRGSRGRAGITLTEILISIMIMGVGLVSLATLFPLGLMRLRAAAVRTRSAFLVESAAADIAARNLLARSSFLPPSNPYYTLNYFDPQFTGSERGKPFDPWIQDTPLPLNGGSYGVYRGWGGSGSPLDLDGDLVTGDLTLIPGPGLPVAYDPLWRYQTAFNPWSGDEYRFAVGIGIRNDPNGGSSSVPSVHGLQRITNFHRIVGSVTTPAATAVPSIFVSPDDIVFQSSDFLSDPVQNPTGSRSTGSASPLVPDMSAGMVNDWMYSWMFTGRRSDAVGGSVYEGDIVIFHGRPLAIDEVINPLTGGKVAAGEPVVEAVFGYSTSLLPSAGAFSYGVADRVVLLRWPTTVPDPEVRVGRWIADVTYERFRQRELDRPGNYPSQRCHWYQVVKTSPADTAKAFVGDGAVAYRSMTVVVNTPVRSKTPLINATDTTRGDPYHVNVALVSPYVVNVFPRTFTTR